MSGFPDSDPGKGMRTDSASRHNREFYDHAANEGYADGAPHLKHRRIRELYDRLLKDAMTGCSGRRVLDLGAGNGQVTRLFFERDAQVTAVDISEAQLRELQSVCAAGKGRLTVHCGDATVFMAESTDSWDVIIANSFLHHVPDYAALMVAAARKLAAGGLIITFQDPLRYDALTWSSRLFSAGSYFCWRVVQRDALAGMARRIRRSFGRYDPASMHDNAEYHVVRNGVDHLALEKELRAIGMMVQATCYFSAHAVWCQWLGERLGMVNHFALVVRKPC